MTTITSPRHVASRENVTRVPRTCPGAARERSFRPLNHGAPGMNQRTRSSALPRSEKTGPGATCTNARCLPDEQFHRSAFLAAPRRPSGSRSRWGTSARTCCRGARQKPCRSGRARHARFEPTTFGSGEQSAHRSAAHGGAWEWLGALMAELASRSSSRAHRRKARAGSPMARMLTRAARAAEMIGACWAMGGQERRNVEKISKKDEEPRASEILEGTSTTTEDSDSTGGASSPGSGYSVSSRFKNSSREWRTQAGK